MAKKTVSLVLGSGGARGLAHIGIIEWLTENGYEIRSISGSSMGALIGGIYATGKLDVYTRWVKALEKMDVFRLLDFSFLGPGLFKGDRVMAVLEELIGEVNIEDLPISFTAVATDVDAQKEVWLNKGPLFDAIRASIAIPTIFTPFKLNGRRLLDGGLINPIPIAPTLQDITDITIAVNLSAKPESKYQESEADEPNSIEENGYHKAIADFIDSVQEKLGYKDDDEEPEESIFDMLSLSIDTMQNSIAQLKLAAYSPDVIVDVPKNVCTFYEFFRAKEVIDIGRDRAGLVLDNLEQ